MKCKHCNGFGWYYNNITKTEKINCEYCNGTGEVEATNDEWRKTCSAEEFAKWLIDQFARIKNDDYMDYRPIGHSFSEIISWLKRRT